LPSIPWYKKYPKDYLSDTASLSLEAHGFYNLMLDYLWINDGFLPADEGALARILRIDVRVVRRHLGGTSGRSSGEVRDKFVVENGKISNPRLTKELSQANEKSRKAAKSVNKRWGYERTYQRNTDQISDNRLLLRNSAQTKKTHANLEGFDRWWKTYPRKVDKPRAVKVWQAKKLESRADELISVLANQVAHERQWQDRQFIPYPATYLNGERWNDEIDTGNPEQPRNETNYERAQRTLEQWESDSSTVLENDGADVPGDVVVRLRSGTE